MKKSTVVILMVCLGQILCGCAVVAVGAVGAVAGTTAAVATDPRNSKTVLDDNTIETKLQYKYNNYANSNIYVTSYNGSILLTGQASTQQVIESAIFAAKVTPGVRQIYNYVTVRLPQSVSAKATDSYTTTQVKAKIFTIQGVSSNSVKVITTDNIVYLCGIVTKDQAQKVAQAASNIGGVQKVVTLFEYIK